MNTVLPLVPRQVPLTQLESGVLRVTGTRIPLVRIVEEYMNGSTPEEIVDRFDTLRLSDVYSLIAFYIDNKSAVDQYVRDQDEKAEDLRQRIEAGQPWRAGFKETMLKRWAEREAKNAATGG